MARAITGRLVIATHNKGKLVEMRELLQPYGIEAISAGELGLPEPEETGASFVENAFIKANAAALAANLPALSDDSGLCVNALNNAPGIYSARWAGDEKNFTTAMARVERALLDNGAHAPFSAHFISALSIVWPDGHEESFEGRIDGTLVFPPRGTKGFGYDPIFMPEGLTKTFGELTAFEKHGLPADGSVALSHRARAFQALARTCLISVPPSFGL